jgi:hypothetical protein
MAADLGIITTLQVRLLLAVFGGGQHLCARELLSCSHSLWLSAMSYAARNALLPSSILPTCFHLEGDASMAWTLFSRRQHATTRTAPSNNGRFQKLLRIEQLENREMLTTFYLSPTGSDSNPGTLAQPMYSLQNAQWSVHPGDTVYLESGTYSWSTLWWQTSGTSSARIYISSAPSSSAIIDGTHMYSGPGSYAFGLDASYVTVENLSIINSPGAGLEFFDAVYCTADNVTAYNNQDTGIRVGDSADSTMLLTNNDTVQNCTVYNNCLENSPTERTSGTIWGAGIGVFGAKSIVVQNNNVARNFGEGIDIICANWCYVQNNTSQDNFSVEMYLDNATNTTVQNNFAYCSGLTYYYRDGNAAIGIALANETHGFQNLNNYNTIQNNIVVGGEIGFAAYDGYGLGYEFRNTAVINNTFYGASYTLVYIQNAMSTNVNDRLVNNIFEQTGSTAQLAVFTSGGVYYDHNLWWGGNWNNGGINGTGDLWHDPLLTSPGGASTTGYELGSGSPAIAAGNSSGAPTYNFGWAYRGSTINIGAW